MDTAPPPLPSPPLEPTEDLRATAIEAAHAALPPEPDAPPLLNFEDTEVAFRYLTDADLARAELLFRSFQVGPLVKLGPRLATWALQSGLPVRGLLKTFLYQHFCGGETLAELAARTRQMKDYGVDTLLDYGVEGERTERGFQQTADGIRQTIDFARQHDHIPFVAMKLTGIGDIDVLTTVQSSREDGFADLRYQKTRQRLAELCAYAAQQQQPLLVDAEESWIQDVVDQAVEEEMALHNRHQVVIYTTIQMYRHDRLQYLRDLHQRARAEGWRVGVKLVRGAYLEKENRRAHALRYPTPMQPNKYRTDHDFNEATVYILEHLADFAVCLGTHNESSCLLAAEALQRLRIPRQHPDVFFSQLYGMSDNLSFGLAHAGLRVAKYVPYGPLEAVLPYLFRRANENSSIAGQSSRELQLIQLEQQRRKRQRR